MMFYWNGGRFADTGKGSQISFDDGQTSVGAERIFQRMDDFRAQDAGVL